MNEIVIGIMCFGDDYYLNHTKLKLEEFINHDLTCYVLTDKPAAFNDFNVNIVKYDRSIKSYHDKIILVKHILKYHNICVLIDADMFIFKPTFFDILKNYKYKKGITYIDTLKSHSFGKQFIREIQMNPENVDWYNYRKYVEKIYPEYDDLETIYEYLIVFNREGLNNGFYRIYEQLQTIKESCDIMSKEKEVNGAGEGVSIHISAKVTNCQIQRDEELYESLKGIILNKNRI